MEYNKMRYRTFGRIGWQVSEIGFGAWAIGGSWGPQNDQDSLAALHRALDLGVNFIDTAQGYGNGHSERLIGQVLKARGQRGGGPVRVATKIPPTPGHWPPFPYDDCAERYPEGDFRRNDFKGDRLLETIRRVETVRETIQRVSGGAEKDMPSVAIRFALHHSTVSTVIPGIRNITQAEQNCAVSDQPPLSDELFNALKEHNWQRGFWYGG